jgi:hypothetical protein
MLRNPIDYSMAENGRINKVAESTNRSRTGQTGSTSEAMLKTEGFEPSRAERRALA